MGYITVGDNNSTPAGKDDQTHPLRSGDCEMTSQWRGVSAQQALSSW
jgi:hypothetical protein